MFLSVLAVGEIRRWILLVAARDQQQARDLSRWLDRTVDTWRNRILPVDEQVAALWAELMTPSARPVVDALIGATALLHDLTLVTRNTADLQNNGVSLLNPFV